MIERILSPALVDAIGWTLLHTLWQGALFALLLGLALVALRTYSAQARYLVAVGFLSAFFLAAGLTAYGHYRQPSEAAALTPVTIAAGAERRAAPLPGATATPTAEPAPTTASSVGLLDRARAYFDRHLPLIVTLWLLGVLVLQLRFLGQLVYVQRLKSYAVSSLPDEWTVRLRALEERLGVRRRVEYLRSHRVESPFTTGWLRPAILLPSRLLDTLGVPELTAILAHELAHIRRNDFAVNVLQTVLGTLFFYHPGVWWMSARIHDEREHCCDDLAVAATGGRIDYARTLVRLQEDQLAAPELAMAYGGGGFGGRVRRLLGGYLGTATFGEGVVTTLIFVAVGSLAIVSTGRASGGLHSPMSMAPASPPETVRPAYEDGSDPSREDVRVLREQLRQRVQRAVREEMRNAAPVVDSTNSFALLMNAIYEGELELVTYLIDRVEDLEGEDERHFFPLMAAASEDEVEIARLLLDRGVDVNHLNSQGWTALTEAADEGSLEVARLLLSAGARVDLRGPGAYRNALEMAASEGHTAMLELLIENGGDPAATNALHLAANEGEVSIVRLLLHLGVDVNGRDEHGRTPLMHAASEDQPAVVRLLLAAGADRTLIDEGGRSAMLYASAEGADESIAEMTDGMAAVALQRLSESPEILLGPAGEGILFTVKAMVEMGIDVNITDDSGNTALSRAAAGGSRGGSALPAGARVRG